MTRDKILNITAGVIFRTAQMLRDQSIYTLFLIEEGANALYFTVRAKAHDPNNGKRDAGELAYILAPQFREHIAYTGPQELPEIYRNPHPEDVTNSDHLPYNLIRTIENTMIQGANELVPTALGVLTFAGTASFNLYFRACFDFMRMYSLPYYDENPVTFDAHKNSSNVDYINGMYQKVPGQKPLYIDITELRKPMPHLQFRFSASMQLEWQSAAFFMFICEEAMQCIQYTLRYLLTLKPEDRSYDLAGKLANNYIDDLLILIEWTRNPYFAAITRGVGYIGFNTYFRAVFLLLKYCKDLYIKDGYELQTWEYWGNNLTELKTIDHEYYGLSASLSFNPFTQTFR